MRVYSSSLPLNLRFEIKIAIPTVKIENRSTIDPTIMAVSPRCIDNFTAAFESPIGRSFFYGLQIILLSKHALQIQTY